MNDEDIVMTIDKPHFTVKLHTTSLEVDIKDGAREELEKLLEAKPAFRDSVGLLFQTVVPLDVRLRDIRSVGYDKKGRVKIDIPRRKDLTIPLDQAESKRLIDKLNELIPPEKERALKDAEEARKTEGALRAGRSANEKEVGRGRFEA
jgi:hypothetical protein